MKLIILLILLKYLSQFFPYSPKNIWRLSMIIFILHHAALELISDQVCDIHHKAVLNDAKRRNKLPEHILLDIAVHQSAINPDIIVNSGRPDLIHIFLLEYHHILKLLPENIQKKIELFVHTKNDEIFFVPQSWRIPVHFIRFRGLMEKFLLEKKIILENNISLEITSMSIQEFLKKNKAQKIINFTDAGHNGSNLHELMRTMITDNERTIALIGGYQKGEVEINDLQGLKIDSIKVVDQPTTAWMILNILLSRLI